MKPTCHVSERLKGCCDLCGNWPMYLHLPEDLHGWYCGRCCPACNKPVAKAANPAVAQPIAAQAA